MCLREEILNNRPSLSDLQQFSLELSKAIGASNRVEAAYKAVIMKNYIGMIENSDALIPVLIELAKADIDGTNIVTGDIKKYEELKGKLEAEIKKHL